MQRATIDKQMSIIKRRVDLHCAVSVGAAGAVTLQKWNYPVFGGGPVARTYTAAPTGTAQTSAGSFPLQYQAGSEGIFSVTRTATGLWTVKLQDSYQRLVNLSFYTSVAGGLSNIVAIAENSTNSSYGAAGGGTIGIALLSSTATAADPTSGHIINLTFTMADATEP